MYRLLISLALIFVTSTLSANECRELSGFYTYKAGILLQNEGKNEEAFDVFCNLAYQGDYRAQFKLSRYYKTGIENSVEANEVYALIWAKLSNNSIKSKKRQQFILSLKESMITPQIAQALELFSAVSRIIPTHRRIDQQFKPIDWKRVKRQIYKEYTGSRIKRKEPFGNVKIVR